MARAHGIDISYSQEFFDVAANQADIQFIIIRASNGVKKDSKFDQFVEDIAQVPIRGAYHYFRSERSPAKSYPKPADQVWFPWKDQAKLFLDCVSDKGFHFYALDFERNEIPMADGQKALDNIVDESFSSNAQEWMRYVAKETGKPVLIYTNAGLYQPWMNEWPLWIAQWPAKPNRDEAPNLSKIAATEWKFWQYWAEKPPNRKAKEYGVSNDPQKNVDLNVFNGTMEELRRWLQLDEDAEGDETKTETPVEPVELVDLGPTWREVIVAVKNVARSRHALWLAWFDEANLKDEIMDEKRWDQPFNGLPFEQWPVASTEDGDQIVGEIRRQLQPGAFAFSLGSDDSYTWRDVIQAAMTVAQRHTAIWFTWIDEAGLKDAVNDETRWNKPYDGLPIDRWPVALLIRVEIQEELNKMLGKQPPPPSPPPQAIGNVVKLDVPYISQWDISAGSHIADCGPTCLAMLANAEPAPANKVTVDQIYRDHLKDKGVGEYTSLFEMKRIGNAPGIELGARFTHFKSEQAALAGLKDMIRNRKPFIVLVNYGAWDDVAHNSFQGAHFVLVTGFDQENVYVHDPLFRGSRRDIGRYFALSNRRFLTGWSTNHKLGNADLVYVFSEKSVPILPT